MSEDRADGLRVLLGCDFHLRYNARLAGGLDRAGADVTMLTREHDREFGDLAGAAQEFMAAAAGPRVARRAIRGRVRSPRGWSEALALRRELRRRDPEVIHLQESIANDPRLLVAAGVRRGRFALTVHDPIRHPGDSISRRKVRANEALVRNAGLIFTHGEALREELIALAQPKAPIVVVPHGIAVGDLAPPPVGPAILFFGRMSHYKGLDVLLDSMDDVWSSVPEARLTVAGEGEIESHPTLADPRVTVRAGHIPESEVAGLIDAASVVALPYRQASQSGVGSLAKAQGRPIVVTEVGGLPELVSDGSGLIVPPEDPPRFAEALVSVLSDEELAQRLGSSGIRTAAKESSWDVVAARTLAAYREHLTPRR